MEEIVDIYSNFKEGIIRVKNYLAQEFSSLRAGRANPRILDKVRVNYYGSLTPLNQMANITVPEPRCLCINVWDLSAFKDVLKALNEADLGLAPSDDGKVIRLTFPILTEERRKDLVKTCKKLTEEAKISLRNERRDALDLLKALKKDNLITEDDLAGAEKEIQKILDGANAELEDMCKCKEKEIMEV